MRAAVAWTAFLLAAAGGFAAATDRAPATRAPAANRVVATGAWARATPQGLKTGAAYVTLEGGGTADTLVAARLDGVTRIEFHESRMDDGVARMRPLPTVPVAPHETVIFAPSGRHLMLLGLTRPLVAGERRTLVLVLERAGEIQVELDVRPVTATGAPERH